MYRITEVAVKQGSTVRLFHILESKNVRDDEETTKTSEPINSFYDSSKLTITASKA